MTVADLVNAHAAAGAAYSAAVQQLHDAYIELASLDQVMMNSNVGYAGAADVRTFHPHPQNPGPFQHPTFAPIDPSKCWRDELNARRDALLKSLLN